MLDLRAKARSGSYKKCVFFKPSFFLNEVSLLREICGPVVHSCVFRVSGVFHKQDLYPKQLIIVDLSNEIKYS